MTDFTPSQRHFEETDFVPEEQEYLSDCAAKINETVESIQDSNDIVRAEIGTDLAQLVIKLAQRGYDKLLDVHWLSLSRQYKLPRTAPEDVRDEFNVHLFNLCKGRLTQIAINSYPVSDQGCLNTDDYNADNFGLMVGEKSRTAAEMATTSYIELRALKAELRAAREAAHVSVASKIWAFVGWDSPMDFLVDVGLTVATGGASKIVRWGQKAVKATKRLRRGVNAAERVLRLEQRAYRMEIRVEEIRKAAEAFRKGRAAANIPMKLLAGLREISKAEKQLKLLSEMTKRVKPDYIRSLVSTIAARHVTGGEVNSGSAATYELARQSILSAVNGGVLGAMIEEIREDVSFTNLIFGTEREQASQRNNIFLLLALLITREMIVRLTIQTARKRTVSVEIFVTEFEGAFFNALESVMMDVPVMSKARASELARTFVSTIRKIIAGMAQKAFREIYGS
ncbi:MAG: hypothetical protein NT117_08850 [Gammaproteobacteria bacterium]|nr:hypothetical protein [Gammaproteobacteria bacterium]